MFRRTIYRFETGGLTLKISGIKNALCATLAMLLLLPAAVGLADTGRVPPSTNPANFAIYPSKGQDTNQQMQDQLASYNWATQQTGWDPYEAHDQLAQQGYAAAQTAEQAKGGLIRGGARGGPWRAAWPSTPSPVTRARARLSGPLPED
jgi:hypothetical protein